MAYTKVNTEEVASIFSKYTLGAPSAFVHLKGGLANSNYRVDTDTGAYLLKICNEKTYEELVLHVAAMLKLKKADYKTSYPYPKTNAPLEDTDSYILKFNQDYVIIYEFVFGQCGSYESTSLNRLKEIGKQVALLSLVDEPQELGLPTAPMGYTLLSELVKSMGKNDELAKHELHEVFKTILNEYIEKTEAFKDVLSLSLIHSDVFCDNILYGEQEDDLTIIDFEEISYDYAMLDVGMTIIGCCCKDGKMDLQKREALLSGYTSTRTLSEQELDLIQLFTRFSAASIVAWRFRQFNIAFPDEERKDLWKEMLPLVK
eukprot:TRINITY_DN6049_c0_g1_i1.p1 TRINITY_DN6049_c0_g1~~TRINITY_DN6049_c0_g1_i1.p1  ORF type:complete len:328 (+),score=61.73 TRINITY_DN6049_c0_g1_i1:37-984(+)